MRNGALRSTYAVHLPFLNIEFVDAHTDGWNLHRTWEFHQRALDDFDQWLFAELIVRFHAGRRYLRQLARPAQFHTVDLNRERLSICRGVGN